MNEQKPQYNENVKTFRISEENLTAKKSDRRSKTEEEKSQNDNYIFNPESGRYVLKTGVIGKKILREQGEIPPTPAKHQTDKQPSGKQYKINCVSRNFHQTRLTDHYPKLKESSTTRYQINLLNHHREPIERSTRHQMINLGREIRQELVAEKQIVESVASEEDDRSSEDQLQEESDHLLELNERREANRTQTYQRSAVMDDWIADQKKSKILNRISERQSREKMYIYTDGAVSNNGGKRSKGGVGVFFGLRDGRNISEAFTKYPITNQRAELWAIVRALQVIMEHQLHLTPEVKIVIFTDSMYSLNVITGEWKARDNLDLIGEAWKLLKQIPNVNLKHVKAHRSSKGNIMADKLAQNGKMRT